MANPYDRIDCERRLLEAYVNTQLRTIADTSSDISGDAARLKEWFDRYCAEPKQINPPEIDWSPYLLTS